MQRAWDEGVIVKLQAQAGQLHKIARGQTTKPGW